MVKLGEVLSDQEVFPASSNDNAIVRWDGAGGKTIQNSSCYIDDSGNLTVGGNVIVCGSCLSLGGSVCVQCSSGCLIFYDTYNASGCCLSDLAGGGGSSLWVDGGSYVYHIT